MTWERLFPSQTNKKKWMVENGCVRKSKFIGWLCSRVVDCFFGRTLKRNGRGRKAIQKRNARSFLFPVVNVCRFFAWPVLAVIWGSSFFFKEERKWERGKQQMRNEMVEPGHALIYFSGCKNFPSLGTRTTRFCCPSCATKKKIAFVFVYFSREKLERKKMVASFWVWGVTLLFLSFWTVFSFRSFLVVAFCLLFVWVPRVARNCVKFFFFFSFCVCTVVRSLQRLWLVLLWSVGTPALKTVRGFRPRLSQSLRLCVLSKREKMGGSLIIEHKRTFFSSTKNIPANHKKKILSRHTSTHNEKILFYYAITMFG